MTDQIKVNIQEEPEIKVYIDGTRGDASIEGIPGLQEALDQKANVVHEHNISDVVNLQTELNNINNELSNKAEKGDNSDITSLSGITGGISTVDYIDFNILTASLSQEARLNWNETEGTLNLGLKGGNVTLQIGQEQVVRCENNTGFNMFKGQAVYIQGSTGTNLNIRLAQSNIENTNSKTFGILTENIANNNSGYVTTAGLVRNINTLHLTEGQAVYLSPNVPGGLTSTKPVSPNNLVFIGWCVKQHASVGAIFVHIINGFELEELNNVLISNPQTNDILVYNSTSCLWENKQVDIINIQNQLDAINLELNGKANTVHTHNSTDIADFNLVVNGLVDSAITNLKAETDPFPQYLTDAEGDAQYSQLGHIHSISEVTNLQTELDGKASLTHTHTLDDLSNVVFTNPTNGQILKFNGTNWVNSDNVAITSLSGLLDTSITTPTNGQLIRYNSTTQKWENFTPDYASGTHTHTSSNITDFNTSVNGLVNTAIDNHKLEENPHPQYLTQTEADALYSPLGGSMALDNLIDVALTTPTAGQVLKYNGSQWVNDVDNGGGGGTVEDQILNGVVDKAPSQNAVYDALQLKQDKLISGTNIKTINGTSLLGSGDLVVNTGITDHGNLTGLGDDDHIQYHNDTRGDLRYYTKTQLDNGQLDNRYYTETETNTLLNNKANISHNHAISDITNLQTTLDGKQETLVSGTNIKTINGTSILGSGDITISNNIQGFAVQDSFVATEGQTVFTLSTSATGVSIVAVNGIQQKPTTDYSISGTILTFTYDLKLNDEVIVTYGTNLASSIGIEDQIIDGVTNLAPSQNAVYDALQLKQDKLISGTNIKTINGTSLLGSGDITISGGGSSVVNDSLFSDSDIIKITTNGTISTDIKAEGTTISANGILIKTGNTYLSSTNDGFLPDDYGNIGGVLVTTLYPGSGYGISTGRPVYTGNTGYKHVIIGGLDYLENPSTNPHYAVMGLVTYSSATQQGINVMGSLSLTADGFDTTPGAEELGVIAVIARPGSSNLEIMHRAEGGIPTGTYIDLGTNFPKISYQHLRIEIVKLKSSPLIKVSVKNILTGAYEERILSSNIPSPNLGLQPIFYTKDSVGNKKCCLSFVKMVGLRNYNG